MAPPLRTFFVTCTDCCERKVTVKLESASLKPRAGGVFLCPDCLRRRVEDARKWHDALGDGRGRYGAKPGGRRGRPRKQRKQS